jgi:hypothetical protein
MYFSLYNPQVRSSDEVTKFSATIITASSSFCISGGLEGFIQYNLSFRNYTLTLLVSEAWLRLD